MTMRLWITGSEDDDDDAPVDTPSGEGAFDVGVA